MESKDHILPGYFQSGIFSPEEEKKLREKCKNPEIWDIEPIEEIKVTIYDSFETGNIVEQYIEHFNPDGTLTKEPIHDRQDEQR